MKRRAAAAFTGAVLMSAAACSSSGGGRGATGGASQLSGGITVDAASSLTEAFTTLQEQFVAAHPGTKITFNFGASSDLETEINNGAPVDVFASAATSNMDAVKTAVHPRNFVTNTLEVATPPSNPAHIASVTDLAKSGVKVAVCDPAVPCGAVAQQVFKNAKIHVTPAAQEADVKSTLAAVESGEVDAGMVYVTDVRAAGKQVHGVTIPSDLNATTEYPIATLSDAPNPALAKAFVEYVLSAYGRKVLLADGFTKP